MALLSCGAMFLAILDSTIANLAVADLRGTFASASVADLFWVIPLYAVVFAAPLAPAGRLADVMGRRALYTGGVGVFTAASPLCALAPSPPVLLVARAVQGAGAAAMIPASLVALGQRELGGRRFGRGDGIVLMPGAANRDPAAFTGPGRLDLRRYCGRAPGAPRHPVFSNGPHHCPGSRLARMEMDVALRALLRRAPGMTLVQEDPPQRDLFLFRGPLSLPARLRPRPGRGAH